MADPDQPAVDGDGPPDDPRAPLWARVVGFVVVLGFLGLLIAVVVSRDRSRDQQAGSSGATARTVALPPDNGGSMQTTSTMGLPPGSGPDPRPRQPRTNDDVALALEGVLKRDVGFIHKVSCQPGGTLTKGEVLECHAASEPPIREAPPSSVLAVVIDDDGRVVWARTPGDSYTIDSLTADPSLSCDALVDRRYPYAVVLAYWEVNGRPAALDPTGSGRPCTDRYAPADIDAAWAAAL